MVLWTKLPLPLSPLGQRGIVSDGVSIPLFPRGGGHAEAWPGGVAEVMTKIYNRQNLENYRKQLRNNLTKSEIELWSFLKHDQTGHRFRRQYGIGNYIVDFYCPKLKLAIEIDGFTHAEESVFKKDISKENYLKSQGITVRRYNDQQVFGEIDNVLLDIENVCRELSTASATPPIPLLERGGSNIAPQY